MVASVEYHGRAATRCPNSETPPAPSTLSTRSTMTTQRRLAQLVTAVQANMASDAPAVGEFDSCAPSASSHPTPR